MVMMVPERPLIGHGPRRSDHELVAACLDGDQSAWVDLVSRYKRLIFSIPLRHGMGRDEAADVFQAVCLDLVNELARLRDPQALPAWLARTTVHKVGKMRRRNVRFVPDEDGRVAEAVTAPPEDMPDATLRQLQQEQALREAVNGLSDRCRQMVRMLFLESPPRPYRDVARELGVATGSIGFLRSRCLDKLRAALEKAGV
jgi:RNA polymerase sigma factor (sigma-70 family)